MNEKLAREIKLVMILGFAITLLTSCFEGFNFGLLGNFLSILLYYSLGEARIIVPILIFAFAILYYTNQNTNLKVLAITSVVLICNFCTLSSFLDPSKEGGGFIGKLLYLSLGKILGEKFLVFIISLIFGFVIYKVLRPLRRSFLTTWTNVKSFNDIKLLNSISKRFKGDFEMFQNVFDNHKVDATVIKKINGLTIDRYLIELGKSTRLDKVRKLVDEFKIASRNDSLTIGNENGQVYIEVPRFCSKGANYGGIINSQEFRQKNNFEIPIGQNINAEVVYADLRKFPHVLIAGASGGGKSVFLHSLILSLLSKNNPNDLRFIMIDPKVMELINYNGIAHLIGEVEFEHEKAIEVINYLVNEMKRRNKLIADDGFRNIETYNEKSSKKLPRIVLVIDELANLMGDKKINFEAPLIELANMSRACGIHLIFSTQHPNAQVLTSRIKSNILTRIAFKVKNSRASYAILDKSCAEDLHGNGDMYFLMNGKLKAERLQGFFVSEEETEEFVYKIKSKYNATLSDQRKYFSTHQDIEQDIKLSEPYKKLERNCDSKDYICSEFVENILSEVKKENEFESYYKQNFKNKNSDIDDDVLDFEKYKKEKQGKDTAPIFQDALTDEVVNKSIEYKTISINWIMRTFKLNSKRAIDIYNEILKLNIIAEQTSQTKPRQILIDSDEWKNLKNNFIKSI